MMRGSQLARALQTPQTWRSLWTGLRQHITTKEQFLEKLSSKKYREILGIAEDRAAAFRDKDLHRAYLNQVKKFHSDNVQSEEKKREFQEITKCIIAAYDMLKKEDEQYRPPNAGFFEEEEEVAQQLFSKSYNQIKYDMYAPGKEQMRTAFLEELQKRRAAKGQEQQQQQKSSPTPQQPPRYSSYTAAAPTSSSEGGMGKIIALLVACGLLSIPLLTRKDGSVAPVKQVKVREYTEKEYDVMQLNAKKILMKPMQQFYNTILKRRPHMLIYPTGKDPHILEQLTRYSIAPDIHLYEVPSKYFLSEDAAEQLRRTNTVEQVEKYQLTETKPNTLLTLSLEAERALQNVYVLADDVLKEIKEKGSFTPPKVFFKFHGYMMVELRDKPFSTLQCYKNTKYISLFDLYFDYYSPIFFKRDHFREYLAGFEQEAPQKNSRYFGNVYLNYRKIPKAYLQYGEKVVIMRDIKKSFDASGSLKNIEQAYRESWENYYARFEKNWKKYCTHQSQGKIIY